MKKVYIVKGSEDGNLGVYSTFKKAYERAKEYVSSQGTIKQSYQTALKDSFRLHAIESPDFATASIEQFYINQ